MPDAFEHMQQYVERHVPDLRPNVLPGVRGVLRDLDRRGHLLGLLTGNLSRIATAKMQAAGLEQYFDVGGFGEESELRASLVPVAIAAAGVRAGHDIPPEEVIVIGDTPLDIEAGKLTGTRTVGVATGPYSPGELEATGADLVLPSFADTRRSVEDLISLLRPLRRTETTLQ
jgi:phosphoglycolate phosphatase-like HAD superfamily hydrolase